MQHDDSSVLQPCNSPLTDVPPMHAGLFSLSLPNILNFGFDYHTVCVLVMLSYLPGLPMLYGYMLGQRGKQLGSKAAKSKTV